MGKNIPIISVVNPRNWADPDEEKRHEKQRRLCIEEGLSGIPPEIAERMNNIRDTESLERLLNSLEKERID